MIFGVVLLTLPGILCAFKLEGVKGRPRASNVVAQFTSDSAEKCVAQSFLTNADWQVNAVAYSANDSRCFTIVLQEWIYKKFVYYPGKSISNDVFEVDKGWITYFAKAEFFPFILWPLNEDAVGMNVGTGGHALDLTIPNNSCPFTEQDYPIIWKQGAPFCKTTEKPSAAMVSIVQNGNRLLDFSKEFTIEFWIKSYASPFLMNQFIIGSVPISATRVLFYPSRYFDQLTLALSDDWTQFDITTTDGTGKLQWRHLAITYQPPNKVAFYKNGITWPIWKKQMPDTPKIVSSSHIVLFSSTVMYCHASFAMVGIHKKALSQSVLHKLKIGSVGTWSE